MFFALLAALWIFYAVTFNDPDRLAGVVEFVVRHNSYLDLLLQMLLGYGMVVLLMEDVKRDVDAAHAELAVAHDELKRLALHDSLTGVMNRRAWTEGIGLEAVRFGSGRPTGLTAIWSHDNPKKPIQLRHCCFQRRCSRFPVAPHDRGGGWTGSCPTSRCAST